MSNSYNESIIVPPGENIRLSAIPTDVMKNSAGKSAALKKIAKNAVEMAALAKTLYAEDKQSLLLVLQAMDTAGKDGTIRSITRGVNPRSCVVTSFKKPTEHELDRDYLWRVHRAVPGKGTIGIFNRSHYEDVLVVRVHNYVPEKVWSQRYDQINDFERLLAQTGTRIVKCFLHISKETQRERLQDRIDNEHKHWKFNPGDLEERKLWDDYQQAYEDALNKCSTEEAPWHIVPSDRKWHRNLIVSELVLKTLKSMKPKLPTASGDFKGIVVE